MRHYRLLAISVLTLGFAFQASATFMSDGLVAYYPFNGNANDASGNGNHATPQGNYQFLENGTLHLNGDNSLFYNGGGYVALPNYGNLNSGFTMSIWAQNETYADEFYAFFGNVADKFVWFGRANFRVNDGVSQADFSYDIGDFSQYSSSWKQLLLAYEPGLLVGYLNGEEVGRANITLNPFPLEQAALGRHWWSGNSSARMSMDLDNFRVYNRGLSETEVVQLYNFESGNAVPDSGGMPIVACAAVFLVIFSSRYRREQMTAL